MIGPAFSLMILSLIGTADGGDECRNWAKQCRDIQRFRRERAFPEQSITVASACTNCPDSISKNLVTRVRALGDSLSSTPRFNQVAFRRCLEEDGETVKRLQARDLRTLTREMRRRRITKISVADLDRIFSRTDSAFNRVREKIRGMDVDQDFYREYTLSGPFQNLEESYTGRKGSENSLSSKKFDQSVKSLLEKIGAPDKVFEALVKAAETPDEKGLSDLPISPRTTRTSLTPAIAKLLLYEVYRERMQKRPTVMRQFLNKMSLKFDFQSPDAARVTDADTVTLHNGYFLGAMPNHYPTSDFKASSGIDCTAVIQKCEEQAGLKTPPGFKLLSSRLAALTDPDAAAAFSDLEPYRSLYRAEPYQCEAQLKVGDLVAFNGHAFVFGGYEADRRGRMQMVTFEAIAGEYRNYGKTYREIYAADPCSPPQFSSGGQARAAIVRVAQ